MVDNNVRKIKSFAAYQAAILPEHKSFKVSVKRYFTDTGGQILGKNTVPSFAQTKYPVFLFGEFDRAGGYYMGHKEIAPQPGLFYIFNATVSNFFDFIQFSGVNTIVQNLTIGDHVIVYADDPLQPNFFVWFVISGERRAYSSILCNPLRDGIKVFNIKYFTDSFRQLTNDIVFINYDEIGTILSSDKVNPYTFKTPDYQQPDFIDLKINVKITNWNGIYFNYEFDCDNVEFIFNYKL